MIKKYRYNYFFSKKFQGLGFLISFDNPVAMQEKSYYLDLAFFWFRFWLTIDFYKK